MDETFNTVAKNLRVWKIKLGKILNKLERRATTRDILDIAENICPTVHEFGGGQLFLSWVLENGKKSIMKWMEEENGEWSKELRKELLRKEVPRWVMHTIVTINTISQKNTKQLFYPSLVLEWKGLSRTGMDIISHMGHSLQAKQYLLMKHELAMQEKTKSLDILLTMNPVVWVDNFAKNHGVVFYRTSVGTYYDANYTAMALMYSSEHVQDMSIKRLSSGGVIPCCSPLMLNQQARARCAASFNQFDKYNKVLLYDNCKARQPEYEAFIIAPQHHVIDHDIYGDSPNGMKDLRTFGMIDSNISEQKGLLEVIEYLYKLLDAQNKYMSVVVDPGIYWRAYKVSMSRRI